MMMMFGTTEVCRCRYVPLTCLDVTTEQLCFSLMTKTTIRVPPLSARLQTIESVREEDFWLGGSITHKHKKKLDCKSLLVAVSVDLCLFNKPQSEAGTSKSHQDRKARGAPFLMVTVGRHF